MDYLPCPGSPQEVGDLVGEKYFHKEFDKVKECAIVRYMKTIVREIPQKDYKGDGSSLHGESRGVYSVNRIEVRYINWVAYPENAHKDRLHASVDLFGPTTTGKEYTDRGIEKALNGDSKLLMDIQVMIVLALKAAGIRRTVPQISLSWSEYGMQHRNGWNFDVNPKS